MSNYIRYPSSIKIFIEMSGLEYQII